MQLVRRVNITQIESKVKREGRYKVAATIDQAQTGTCAVAVVARSKHAISTERMDEVFHALVDPSLRAIFDQDIQAATDRARASIAGSVFGSVSDVPAKNE